MNSDELSMIAECDIIGNIENKSKPMHSNDIIKRKICSKCKFDLPVDMFNKRNGIFICYCRQCQTSIAREWRLKNLNKVKRREKLYRSTHKNEKREQHTRWYRRWVSTLESRFSNWKKGAHKRNIPFDLTMEQITSLPLMCHYTGVELTLDGNKQNTISLDRIDSSKGYTITNVVFCCSFVNIMKNKMSYEDFLSACKMIAEYHKS
jgi:hypothetical protein